MKIDVMIEKEMKDSEFAELWGVESEKLETAIALYKAREEAGLTQVELAERAKTTQATIARIERGDNVSFDKLSAIAHAMGKKLKIEFA
ncbi:hypothetical protein IGI37_000383 [Enterococcus sp. AZ194]|uniref:helix-turn-helix domain-containing protein n=1 Tax=Enterococcus sp. AZ194 TaxID=2774629 RepID=UPI003F2031ED